MTVRLLTARARKLVCSFVLHCYRQPLCGHRTGFEACCVWKNAAVKQQSVRSLAFKAERFILAAAAVATDRAR